MTEFEVGKRVDVSKGKSSEKATIIEISATGKQLKVLFDSADETSVVSAAKCAKARGRAPAAVVEKVAAIMGGGKSTKKSKPAAKSKSKPVAEKAAKPVKAKKAKAESKPEAKTRSVATGSKRRVKGSRRQIA